MKEEDYIEKKIEEAWKAPFSHVPEEEVERSWRDLSRKLDHSPKRGRSRDLWSFISFAAAILVLIGGYFYLENQNPVITTKNFTTADMEVRLSDGSRVVLKSGSSLTYKKYFTEDRVVSLEGEAFFDVVKDSLREFKVNTGISTIRVLGTSFLVKGMENDDAEVSLYTGRVSVSIKGIAASWGLIPGERLTYSKGAAQVERFDVKMSFETGNRHIDIEGMKMKDFIAFLEKRFEYKFSEDSYDPKKRVTLRINKDDTLEQILKLLSIINNKTYEIKEKTKEIVLIKE